MKAFVVVLVCVALGIGVESSKEVMAKISLNYKKALDECIKEQNLPESIREDFTNFWKDDYVVTNRFTGCALACLATKHNMIDESGKLHHGKAYEFATTHGADDAMANTLIKLFHDCENSTPSEDDKCMVVVNVIKCFKAGVHKLDWAPTQELMMGEVLSEV